MIDVDEKIAESEKIRKEILLYLIEKKYPINLIGPTLLGIVADIYRLAEMPQETFNLILEETKEYFKR